MVKLMDREDKVTAIWIVVAWAVLIVAMCIRPDFFTQQLFESTAALWVTIGAMTVVSFFLPAFVRKLRGK